MWRLRLGVIMLGIGLLSAPALAQEITYRLSFGNLTLPSAAPPATQQQQGTPSHQRQRGKARARAPRLTAPGGDLFRARPKTYAPRFDRVTVGPGFPGVYTPFVPGFYYPPVNSGYAKASRSRDYRAASRGAPVVDASGYLRLDVQPGTAEMYIDGYYAGTADDFEGGLGGPLEAGSHRIEIRAPGFETVVFDVRTIPGRTITYRGVLSRAERASPPPAPVTAQPSPKTFYVIPNCYAGDKPPRQDQLRPGCNAADVRTIG